MSAVDLDKLQQPQRSLAVVVVVLVVSLAAAAEEVYLGWVLSPVRRKPSRMCLVPPRPSVLLLLPLTVSCDVNGLCIGNKHIAACIVAKAGKQIMTKNVKILYLVGHWTFHVEIGLLYSD